MIRRLKLFAACALLGAGCTDAPAPRLVLLLTVDTLRADELGAYGSSRGLTPHLDELAGQSTLFTAAYAPAAFTLPSIAALLTGHHPEALGIRSNESGLPIGVPTLATALGESGWQAGAVVGNFVLRRESGVARGFQRFDDDFPSHEAVRHWPERDAANTTDAALELLDGCTQLPAARCFLWVHYQDPHGPYEPPPGWRDRYLAAERAAPDGRRQLPVGRDHRGLGAIPTYQYMEGRSEVAWYRAGYRAEVAYMDEQLGRLVAGIEARQRWRDAVVIFAADHGEALGDHGVWFAHGAGLTDDQVRVPFMIRRPGEPPARRDDVATLLDVFPTLLAHLGVASETAGRSGRDLFARAAAAGASVPYMTTLGALPESQFALVADGFKFITVERDGVFDGRLYALGREDTELGAASPQLAAQMRERLRRLRNGVVPVTEAATAELSEADRERLRDLGYIERGEESASHP
ncbi:MAG: sulfatase [Deltaproteobacteria bacterium]|nr:sulfatase [Deltaproteobacteria bacterium]